MKITEKDLQDHLTFEVRKTYISQDFQIAVKYKDYWIYEFKVSIEGLEFIDKKINQITPPKKGKIKK